MSLARCLHILGFYWGCASSYGKAYIHGAGEPDKMWNTEQDRFLEAMADAAWDVAEYFKDKIAYINVMCNLSVDCDCCAVAEDLGKKHFMERVESRNGIHTIEAAVLSVWETGRIS